MAAKNYVRLIEQSTNVPILGVRDQRNLYVRICLRGAWERAYIDMRPHHGAAGASIRSTVTVALP